MANSQVTLVSGIDTWVDQERPSRNFGDGKTIGVKTDTGENAYAYIYFNRPFDLGSTIIDAKLRLYTKGAWSASPTIGVKRIDEKWAASKLTWDRRPTVVGSAVDVTQSSNADGDLWEFDLTAMFQTISDGGTYYGLRVESSSTVLRYFYSIDAVKTLFRPELYVEWSDAPQAPTVLSPAGGRQTSLQFPVFRFDYTDDVGETELASVQVQINSTDVWTSPTFDSGEVVTSVPEFVSDGTAWAGLSNTHQRWWRVRVKSDAGLWSPWSDAEQFGRTNKPTFTITNPGSGTVAEWTPPIIRSSVTGGTQEAYRVLTWLDGSPDDVLDDSGRTSGAEDSYTIPKGVLTDGEDYVTEWRLWDTVDREATPGDPTYVAVDVTYAFAEDGTPDPVDTIVAAPQSPSPFVNITVTRGDGAPDYFALVRDGELVETEIDPADVQNGGGGWTIVDRTAKPFRVHEWKVQCFVNGLSSDTNPTDSDRPVPTGLWLTQDENAVFFAQTTDSTFVKGETTQVYYPVAGDRGVTVNQSLRGYEGHVNGLLIPTGADWGDLELNARQWRDRLEEIRNNVGEECVMFIGWEAVRIVPYNITWTPTNAPKGTLVADFDYLEVG